MTFRDNPEVSNPPVTAKPAETNYELLNFGPYAKCKTCKHYRLIRDSTGGKHYCLQHSKKTELTLRCNDFSISSESLDAWLLEFKQCDTDAKAFYWCYYITADEFGYTKEPFTTERQARRHIRTITQYTERLPVGAQVWVGSLSQIDTLIPTDGPTTLDVSECLERPPASPGACVVENRKLRTYEQLISAETIRKVDKIYYWDDIVQAINTAKKTKASSPYFVLDGDQMFISKTLMTIIKKGRVCCSCGLVGSFFYKERQPIHYQYHLTLYGVDHRGRWVPFTKDHIIPRNSGGSNDPSNLKPMCRVCNVYKDDVVISLEPSALLDGAGGVGYNQLLLLIKITERRLRMLTSSVKGGKFASRREIEEQLLMLTAKLTDMIKMSVDSNGLENLQRLGQYKDVVTGVRR